MVSDLIFKFLNIFFFFPSLVVLPLSLLTYSRKNDPRDSFVGLDQLIRAVDILATPSPWGENYEKSHEIPRQFIATKAPVGHPKR